MGARTEPPDQTERIAELQARLERVEKERALFVALVENSSDFIGIADADGKPVYLNPAGRRMVGLAADHPIEGTRIPEYYPPEERAFATEVIVASMIERGHWAGETYFRHWQTGEAIPVSDTHFMIREPGTDRRLGMGTITRDISAMRRATMEREIEAAKFRAMLEAAPDAMIIVDARGVIELINAQAEARFGYTRDELVGQPVESLIPVRLRGLHAGHRVRYDADPRGRPMGAGLDLRARRKDGTEFPVEISLAPMAAGGERLVMAAARDVTERRRVDDERARLAAIVESSEDAIVGKDLDGIIHSWNSGATRLYGYTLEEVRGQPIAVLVPPDRLEENHHALAEVSRGSKVDHYETVRRCKDASLVDVSVSHSPIRDRAGRVVGVSTIARDISAKKLVERKLAASLAEKEALLREIHHRVKNNLQVIVSLLNLQRERVMDPIAQTLLVESQARVRSMALVHEKLYGSKDLGLIDLGDYLRALSSALSHTYGAVARHLALEVHADEVRLGIEAAMPCGLLVNELVSNALKHAYPDDRRGTVVISLRLERAGAELCLEVADDGVGFSEGIDFRRVASLGMQIVVGLTRQLQGTIELERGAGTRFRVRFPSAPAPPP
jgi:PAS domain S-box-containing protein